MWGQCGTGEVPVWQYNGFRVCFSRLVIRKENGIGIRVLQGCGSTPVGLSSKCGSAWLISFKTLHYPSLDLFLRFNTCSQGERKKKCVASKGNFENIKHPCLTEILGGIQSEYEIVQTMVFCLILLGFCLDLFDFFYVKTNRSCQSWWYKCGEEMMWGIRAEEKKVISQMQ